MGLTSIQYRDIMNEYDRTRQQNYLQEQAHLEQVYEIIPEIREINEQIASSSMNAARRMLFHPEEDHSSQVHTLVKNLVHKKRELLIRNHFPADYLDPIYDCTYCKDTGYIGDKKCFCFQQKIMSVLYEQSNLTQSIKDHNFDTFRLDYYSDKPTPGSDKSPQDNMENVLQTVFRFIKDFDKEAKPEDPVKKNLLIHGSAGVGKTFLTTCIAGELIKKGKSVLYLTSYQLFEQLAEHTFHREDSKTNISEMIQKADLLIIDDLGTEMNNAFVNSQLFSCINERILSKKATIINTNFSLNQLSKTYTERISSRLIQFYTILYIYGEDIRIKKAFSTID